MCSAGGGGGGGGGTGGVEINKLTVMINTGYFPGDLFLNYTTSFLSWFDFVRQSQ